jgi:hypothetical protein
VPAPAAAADAVRIRVRRSARVDPEAAVEGGARDPPAGPDRRAARGDPIQRAFDEASGQGQSQTLLWDLTEAITAAAKDDRVSALVLELDDMDGAGQPTLTEVAAAIRKFRDAGKKVAWGTRATTRSRSTTSRRMPTRSTSIPSAWC